MFMPRTPLVLDERVALRRSFGTEAERAAAALRPARHTNTTLLDLAVPRRVQSRDPGERRLPRLRLRKPNGWVNREVFAYLSRRARVVKSKPSLLQESKERVARSAFYQARARSQIPPARGGACERRRAKDHSRDASVHMLLLTRATPPVTEESASARARPEASACRPAGSQRARIATRSR